MVTISTNKLSSLSGDYNIQKAEDNLEAKESFNDTGNFETNTINSSPCKLWRSLQVNATTD